MMESLFTTHHRRQPVRRRCALLRVGLRVPKICFGVAGAEVGLPPHLLWAKAIAAKRADCLQGSLFVL
jgi:hypothetical protein